PPAPPATEGGMLTRLACPPIWVPDPDEALAFYTGKLGLELRDDVALPELNNCRWLTVGVPGQDVAVSLVAVPGPPVFDEEPRQQIMTVMSKGAAGGLMFSTDDCRASYKELKGRGVEFQQE